MYIIASQFREGEQTRREKSSPKQQLENHAEHCRALFARLNEQEKRHVAGLLALFVGHGGVSWVAEAVGLERDCVFRGKAELENKFEECPIGRQRLPGGGRKPILKSPETIKAFEKLVAEYTGGTPRGQRKFVRPSLPHIARRLGCVTPSTVLKWLRKRKFSLRSNLKRLSGPPHPDRNRQFKLIRGETRRFKNAGWPVISVDAKNKELIGNFANSGQKWEAEGKCEEVDSHDFPEKATLKTIPFGIYDIARNEGLVEVGTSLNTARFAVDAIPRWWKTVGKRKYPHVKRLLILADSGGSNGCRIWMWKKLLCEFAIEFGLTITVRHYPRGTSKWNPVEHRLFGPITRSWAGHPLRSMAILLGFIRGTTNQLGLKVKARWNRRQYLPKEKVSKKGKAMLNFKNHKVIPLWNYTIYPKPK